MKMDKSCIKRIVIGALTGFCNGVFGAGGGMIAVVALDDAVKLEQRKAHATALCLILPMTAVSIAVYLLTGTGDATAGYYAVPAFFAGGILGAKLLGKLSSVWTARFFAALMLAAGISMVAT